MRPSLVQIYEGLLRAPSTETDMPLYSAAAVPGCSGHYVGKDRDETACILLETTNANARERAAIRLENLAVQFGIRCRVKSGDEEREGAFTVIQCRSAEPELIRYFFLVGETLLRLLGGDPTEASVARAVNRLALVFQKLQKPSTRSVAGLFGELFLISRSSRPADTLSVWRMTDTSRFDFSAGDFRIDVKASMGRARTHVFSYEQCNPPPSTIALVASVMLERVRAGTTLQELIVEIEVAVSGDIELMMRLHDTVAESLGTGLREAMAVSFDLRLATASLEFFDLREIPGIRGALPVGVSDVHFRSDLSLLDPVSPEQLAREHPDAADVLGLLPGSPAR